MYGTKCNLSWMENWLWIFRLSCIHVWQVHRWRTRHQHSFIEQCLLQITERGETFRICHQNWLHYSQGRNHLERNRREDKKPYWEIVIPPSFHLWWLKHVSAQPLNFPFSFGFYHGLKRLLFFLIMLIIIYLTAR